MSEPSAAICERYEELAVACDAQLARCHDERIDIAALAAGSATIDSLLAELPGEAALHALNLDDASIDRCRSALATASEAHRVAQRRLQELGTEVLAQLRRQHRQADALNAYGRTKQSKSGGNLLGNRHA